MKKREWVIYKLTFPNGKVYIGQTCDFTRRMHGHCCDINKNSKYRIPISLAIRKYGWENVKKEIIKNCKKSNVDYWERYYIKKFKSTNRKFGYNCESGGSKNKTVSIETRKRQSKAKIGRKLSQEQIEKMILARKGKKFSKETIEKLRIASRNRKRSKEEIEHIKNLKFWQGKYGKHNPSSKEVYQINYTGQIIKLWDSLMDIQRKLKINITHVSQVCNGKRLRAYGFIWIYKSDFSKIVLKQKLDNFKNSQQTYTGRVYQINRKTGKVIKKWKSQNTIVKTLGINASDITSCCRWNQKTARGFMWVYEKDYSKEEIQKRLREIKN